MHPPRTSTHRRLLRRRLGLTDLLLSSALAAIPANCGSGAPADTRVRIDLTQNVAGLRMELEERAAPTGVRLHAVEEGLATLRVSFAAETGRIETTHADVTGRLFDFHRWDLPWMPAPDLLCATLGPELAGLDLPRMTSVEVEGIEDGLWYIGDDGSGAPCLRIVIPADTTLPEGFELKYTVLAVELAGTPLVSKVDLSELLLVPHVVGESTRRALAVPAGARLTWPLPAAEGRRLEATLVSAGEAGAGLTVRSTVGSDDPIQLELHAGSDLRFRSAHTADDLGTWTLEVDGPAGSLLWIAEPALVRTREAGDPPNVVFVLIDTLREDRATPELMPALTELGADALIFPDCWATCSWTLPSVSTLFTGAHGGQHQAWLNDRELADGIDTLAEVFSRAGYATAAFTGGVFVDQSFGLDRGFDAFDSSAGGAEAVFGRAQEWLARAGDGPWFLFVHTYEVHSPYEPPLDVAERVLARHPDVLQGRPPEPQAFFGLDGVVNGDPDRIAALLADLYDEEVRYTDGVLGEFLTTLRAQGAFEDSVLAVTSDHGEEFGEHGLFGHTDSLYRETLHVPLVLRLPGGARAGEVDGRSVSHIDFAPTLLDAAGLGALEPDTFIGSSLLGTDASPVYATRNIDGVGLLRAMRAEGCAYIDGPYIYPRGVEGPEVYDLVEDPGQQRNVRASDPRTPSLSSRYAKLNALFGQPLVEAREIDAGRLMNELREMGYVH